MGRGSWPLVVVPVGAGGRDGVRMAQRLERFGLEGAAVGAVRAGGRSSGSGRAGGHSGRSGSDKRAQGGEGRSGSGGRRGAQPTILSWFSYHFSTYCSFTSPSLSRLCTFSSDIVALKVAACWQALSVSLINPTELLAAALLEQPRRAG